MRSYQSHQPGMVVTMDPLEVAALQLATGTLPSERLPDLATEALSRGLDSPALRELAGASPRDVREAGDPLVVALGELGITLLDVQPALWRLVRHTATEIVRGDLAPYDGASWIWHEASYRVEPEGDLRIFIGLASEWEDHPASRPQIETAIVDAAEELLQRPAPRRWVKLMASQGCSPLWQSAPARNLPLAELSLDIDLRNDLNHWATDYDATFGNDLQRSGFFTVEDADSFVARGSQFAEQLQISLGPTWHVEYMPEPTRPPGLRLRQR